MTEQQSVTFTKGKKPREELQLPIIHFIAADDWMEKLGYENFCIWLKFYSWCDRGDARLDKENDVIPTSLNKIIKRLGIRREKFYKKVIPTLWNYALIDLAEYTGSYSNGQKPMNIIVYDAPKNDATNKYKPLEKVRDYETEYTSTARTFAKTGGRKKSGNTNVHMGGSENGTGGGSENGTGVVPKTESNNVSNLYNDSNSESNDSNIINPSKKSREEIENDIRKLDVPTTIKNTLLKKIDRLMDDYIDLSDIENDYKANIGKLSLAEYENALQFALNDQKKIENIRALMSKNARKQLEFREEANESKNSQESIVKEKLPKWMTQEKIGDDHREEELGGKNEVNQSDKELPGFQNGSSKESNNILSDEEKRAIVKEKQKKIDRLLEQHRKQ